MRTMARRHVTAWIALLGVAWAALWPLVSAAHARAADESMPLCHMAGMMVAPEETPNAPSEPGDHHESTGTHCPLCIMAFYGAFHAAPEPPPFTFSTGFVTLETHCAPIPFGVEVALPQSRAPPAAIAA
jgi:hypothetical protein